MTTARPFPSFPLGMGGSYYGAHDEAGLQAALETALAQGITHFDTATDYGGGNSERRLGQFLKAQPGRRETVFLASKVNLDEVSADAVIHAIEASLKRLQTDWIDLYYLHWPRTGQDLRPWMEGLQTARQRGLIGAVGVSNFSVAQMQQLAEVGRIDACQIGYNLLWRFPERDVLPYCAEQGMAVVAYSALAHGILSGRYSRALTFAPDDQRWSIALFRSEVWPQVHASVQAFGAVAHRASLPLATLALRWLLHQPGVSSVLVSAASPAQVEANVRALAAPLPLGVLDELTAISRRVQALIPDEGNPFSYHP